MIGTLGRVTSGELSGCVIVSGMPGAGKSTVTRLAARWWFDTAALTPEETAEQFVAGAAHRAPLLRPGWNAWLRQLHQAQRRQTQVHGRHERRRRKRGRQGEGQQRHRLGPAVDRCDHAHRERHHRADRRQQQQHQPGAGISDRLRRDQVDRVQEQETRNAGETGKNDSAPEG
jgi:hypothetical protein